MVAKQVAHFEGEAYHNFIIHITNTQTRVGYVAALKSFLKFCQTESPDDLLFNGDIKTIQNTVSRFLIHLQAEGFSPATGSHHLAALKFFYTMNDLTSINWKKVSKVKAKPRRVANDRPYNTNEIAKMLEKADHRGRIAILLMASTGMREGAINTLKIAHLERIQDIYKIIVYKNDPEEYITFCSPECAKAIDDYLGYRKRYGEIIKPYSPLIREQFDKNDQIQAANPKAIGEGSIKSIIYRAINDAGLREKKNIVKGQPKFLHEVMQSHGLRKFFESQVVDAGMDLFYAELLMGHKNGLAMQSYVKPTISQMLERYMQTVDSITINEENKLRREVQTLKIEKSKMERLEQKIAEFDRVLGLS
jgi:integrase